MRKRPIGKSKLIWQGRLNIKESVQEWWSDKDGVDLHQDWYKWRILVNAVINLAFHNTRRIFSTRTLLYGLS